MGNLRRYYNQNRKNIWRIIIIIAFAFIILRLANYIAKRQNEQTMQNIIAQQNRVNNNQVNKTSDNTETQTGNNSKTSIQTSQIEVIKQFIDYCNKKNLESAYNMLTNECKEQMFNNMEEFERIYYSSAFENISKEAEINKWSNNTYLVYLKKSALATGKVKDENQKGDYITVVKDEENVYKLNINSYIGYKKIEKTKTENNLQMQVISKNIYMDYEEYTIKVINNTEDNILLDTMQDAESIYIEDTNGIKYPSYNHELTESMLNISSGHAKELKIKFYNTYTSNRKIKELVFSNMKIKNELNRFKIEL